MYNYFVLQSSKLMIWETALREEPSQISVILQQKLLAAKLSTVCTVYKQWLATSGCNCGLRTDVKTQDNIPYFINQLLLLLNNYQYNCNNTISSVSVTIKMKLTIKNILSKITVEPVTFFYVFAFCMQMPTEAFFFYMK